MLPVSGAEQLKTSGANGSDAAHDFAERRVSDVGQAGAVFAGRQEQVPEALGARLRLQLLDERDRLPAIALLDLLVRNAARSDRRARP